MGINGQGTHGHPIRDRGSYSQTPFQSRISKVVRFSHTSRKQRKDYAPSHHSLNPVKDIIEELEETQYAKISMRISKHKRR